MRYICAVVLLPIVSAAWSGYGRRILAGGGGEVPPKVPGISPWSVQHSSSRTDDWGVYGSGSDRFTRNQRFNAVDMVNGIPYGVTGRRGTAQLFSIQVDRDQAFLNVMCNGGVGDVDIYIKFNDYPTKRNYDERSAHGGNQEQIILDNPQEGKYYVVLYGYDNFDNVGFEAEFR